MNDVFMTIFILAFDLSFAVFFGNIASKKGFPGIAWGAIGFFFPLLYLITLLLPKRNNIKLSKHEKEEQDKRNKKNLGIFFSLLGVALFVLFIWYIANISNQQQEAEDNYKQYIYDCLIAGYLGLQTDNFNNDFEDQKVYIQDLYKMYINDEFNNYEDFEYEEDDEFTSYYEENEEELKDDYIIIVKETGKNENQSYWATFYYDYYDEQQEILDYSMNYAIVKYEDEKTNNYQNDVVSEKVKIHTLYDKEYFSNYYKKVYEKNINKLKDDYIIITAKGGKIYDKEYYIQ